MSVHTAIRLDEQDRAALKALAADRDMSFSRFLVDTALQRLPEQQATTDQRLDELEQRLQRLEDLAYSGQ